MGRNGVGLAAMVVAVFACSGCGGSSGGGSPSGGASCNLVDGGAVPPFTPVNGGATACGTCAFGSTTAPTGSPYCYVPPASEASMLAMCTSQGGVLLAGCPTAGLVGCCTVSKTEECFYWGTASERQTQCVMASGSWSTSP